MGRHAKRTVKKRAANHRKLVKAGRKVRKHRAVRAKKSPTRKRGKAASRARKK